MTETINSDVSSVIENYPTVIQEKVLFIRNLIYEVAKDLENDSDIEETLKWNEPSYLVKSGSTIRIAWGSKRPNQYGIFFNCKSKLVDTFKELYPDVFNFEGNRAIIFNKDDVIPIDELKHCIRLALIYHQLKHLPMLGA